MAGFDSKKNQDLLLKLLETVKESERSSDYKDVADKFDSDLRNASRRTSSVTGDGFVMKGKPQTVSSPKPNFTMPAKGSGLPAVRKATDVVGASNPSIIDDVIYKTVDKGSDILGNPSTLNKLGKIGSKAMKFAGPALGVLGLLAQPELNPESPEEKQMLAMAEEAHRMKNKPEPSDDLLRLLAGGGLDNSQEDQMLSEGQPARLPVVDETQEELLTQGSSKDITRDPAVDSSPLEILLGKLNKTREESDVKIKEAREDDSRRTMLANIAKALGNIGQAEIQRSAKVDAGIDKFEPVKGADTASQVEKDRDSMLNRLKEEYALLQLGKPKESSELEKAKIDKLKAEADKLRRKDGVDSLSWEQKEEKKAEIKDKLVTKKEQRKELKDISSAEAGVDEQLENVREAKKLMADLANESMMVDTGPIDQFISPSTDEGQKLRQKFNAISLDKMTKMFAGMSKAIDSDAERKFFQQSQVSMGNYPSTNMDVLDQLEKNLVSLKNKSQGRKQELSQPEEGTQEGASQAPYGDTVERGGKTYKWNQAAGKYQLLK